MQHHDHGYPADDALNQPPDCACELTPKKPTKYR